MRVISLIAASVFLCCVAMQAHAQEATTAATPVAIDTRANETRVPLAEPAVAFDINGRTALAGRLRTTALMSTPESPVRNARIVIENRSDAFYTYASGWATFYDGEGIRCGEGLWKLEALAPTEAAEVDTPGLRLTCSPATWRIVAINLVTRTSELAGSAEGTSPAPAAATTATDATIVSTAPATTRPQLPPLEINVNGKTLPLQPGNPLEITVGKERVRIVVSIAP